MDFHLPAVQVMGWTMYSNISRTTHAVKIDLKDTAAIRQ